MLPAPCVQQPLGQPYRPFPGRVKVMDLQLPFSNLHFQPQQHLAFNINNASISLRFRRQLLYWFL